MLLFTQCVGSILDSSPKPGAKMTKMTASSENPAQVRYSAARNSILLAAITATAGYASATVAWWALLPLIIVQLELTARLYDARVLDKFAKRPSPKTAFENPSSVYTWQQLAEHCSEESAWVAVDGLVYDITEFIDRHPGGREIILLAVGRDATDLFNSYHPFTSVPRKLLAKYRIESLETFEHPVYKPDSGFYREAAVAGKDYFTGLDSKNHYTGLCRMLPVYVVFAIAYFTIYYVGRYFLRRTCCFVDSARHLSGIAFGGVDARRIAYIDRSVGALVVECWSHFVGLCFWKFYAVVA